MESIFWTFHPSPAPAITFDNIFYSAYSTIAFFLATPFVQLIMLKPTNGAWASESIAQVIDFLKTVYQIVAVSFILLFVYLIARYIKNISSYARELTVPYAKGNPVNHAESDSTRLLAASALLKGCYFRRVIIDYFDKKHYAFAPEVGVDFSLILRVCKYLEKRETIFHLIFFGISVVFWFAASSTRTESITSFARLVAITQILFVSAFGIKFFKTLTEHKLAVTLFRRGSYDSKSVKKKFEIPNSQESDITNSTNNQNMIIYDNFIPFVGSGVPLGGWSLSVNLSRPKKELGQNEDIIPFEVEELYKEIDVAIADLEFNGIVNRDVLFANGGSIRNEKWILPNIYSQPVKKFEYEMVKPFIGNNDSSIRHYKWIQVFDWGNELIVSHFCRCSRSGKNLFVEVNIFLLTSIADEYRDVDKLVLNNWRYPILSGLKCLFTTPVSIIYAWVSLSRNVILWLDKVLNIEERNIRKQIDSNLLYNYGANRSLRERMSSSRYQHFFQLLDNERYIKILTRELLDTIIKFLDDHNIDTSDLREQQITIINSGVIVQKGDVRAEVMAIGAGATATQAKFGRRVEKKI